MKFTVKKAKSLTLAALLSAGAITIGLVSPTLGYVQDGISALAIKPDGSTILAAASNRVIYRVDPQSLKVVERIWQKVRMQKMEFLADGSAILIHDETNVLRIVDPKSLKTKKTIRKVKRYAYAPKANKIIAGYETYEYKKKKYFADLRVIDAASAKVEKKIRVEGRLGAMAVSDDASTLSILTGSEKDPSETKEQPTSDLSRHERIEFRQRHDQRSASHIVVNLADGTSVSNKTWFSFSTASTMIRTDGGTIVLPNYPGGAMITDDGKTTYIDTGARSQLGTYYDTSTKMIISGAYSSIMITEDGQEEGTVHTTRKLKGRSEYPNQIIRLGDDFYAGTNASRIYKFTPGDGIDMAKPIF